MKKTASGLLALALVAGTLPVNTGTGGKFLKDTANALFWYMSIAENLGGSPPSPNPDSTSKVVVIDGFLYTYTEGMTWEDLITIGQTGWIIDEEDGIVDSDGRVLNIEDLQGSRFVNSYDEILADAKYFWQIIN